MCWPWRMSWRRTSPKHVPELAAGQIQMAVQRHCQAFGLNFRRDKAPQFGHLADQCTSCHDLSGQCGSVRMPVGHKQSNDGAHCPPSIF